MVVRATLGEFVEHLNAQCRSFDLHLAGALIYSTNPWSRTMSRSSAQLQLEGLKTLSDTAPPRLAALAR